VCISPTVLEKKLLSPIISNLTLQDLYLKWQSNPHLYAIEISDEDMNLDISKRLSVDFTITKHFPYAEDGKTQVSHMRTTYIQTDWSAYQVYLKIFKYFKFIFDDDVPSNTATYWKTLSAEKAFEEIFTYGGPLPFTLHLKTNTTGREDCYFCGNTMCKDCLLELNPNIFIDRDILPKIQDKNFQLCFDVMWNNCPELPIIGKFEVTKATIRLEKTEDFLRDPNLNGGSNGVTHHSHTVSNGEALEKNDS